LRDPLILSPLLLPILLIYDIVNRIQYLSTLEHPNHYYYNNFKDLLCKNDLQKPSTHLSFFPEIP